MAHQFDSGFFVREPAWHGLGEVLDDYPADWAEARSKAGLLWEPDEEPVYRVAKITAEEAAEQYGERALPTNRSDRWMVPVLDHKLITRNDTGAGLAIVRKGYELIHHFTMGDLLDEVAQEAGASFQFETAGSLQGGRKVWALARLDEPYTVPGDESRTYPYFAIQNAHDGEGACRIIPTQVRIVCMNTWQLASDLANFEVVIRHAGNVGERVEEAKRTIRATREAAAAYLDTMTELSKLNYNDSVLRTFLEHFIPTPEGATDRLIELRDERRGLCRAMLNQSPTLADLPDTAYKLVQLVGEYTDHLRDLPEDETKRRDIYLRRTMFKAGPGSQIKQNVIDLAREVCTVGA
jgi:phage/plasmid-like protein (TIGR03299 family)